MRSSRQTSRVATSMSLFRSATPSLGLHSRTLLSSTDPSLTSDEKEVCQTIQEGEALAKIIPTTHPISSAFPSPWRSHLKQLHDYNFRPHLRFHDEEDKEDAWKYHHMTGVIRARSLLQEDTLSSHTYTQPTSTTLMSAGLHTPLFDLFSYLAGDAAAMGLLYDRRKCNIEALFSDGDKALTYFQKWTFPHFASALEYKEKMSLFSFTDFNQFKNLIDAKDWKICNEVLAAVNKESLQGIIIDTTHAHRYADDIAQQARERQRELQVKLGMQLPIIYYQSEKEEIQVYTQDEQDLDELKAQIERKLSEKHQPSHLPHLQLFAPEDLSFPVSVDGFLQRNIDKKAAIDILNLIKTRKEKKLSAHDVKEKIKLTFFYRDDYQRFII